MKEGQEMTLVTQNGEDCLQRLSSVSVKVKEKTSSCKVTKVKVSSKSNDKRLTVVFSVDNSKCNTKWIILGAVLGAVVLIAVIVLILVFTLNKSARNCIRPFSRRRRNAHTN